MTPDQKAKRLHYHMYESLEGIQEHAERIVALEELCAGLYEFAMSENPDGTELNFADKMRELGVEVD